MLLELRIGNLALAEDAVLRPGHGLTVLTGETGAGKSLVAGALAILAGGRADRGMIRRGEELAWVEGVIDLSGRSDLLNEVSKLGLCLSKDGLLVLRRELRLQGRGRVLINGFLSSLAILEQLGDILFVIQSQHQQRELSSAGFARDILDEALGNGELRASVARTLAEMRAALADLQRRRQEHELACQQEDFWRCQYEELASASLDEKEEQELSEAIAVKRHAQVLQESAATALDRLVGEQGSARDGLGAAIAALRRYSDKSHRLDSAMKLLEHAADQATEAASELERFLDGFMTDPRGLAELEERKALYEELRRKHRRDVPGLLVLQDQLRQRLGRFDHAFADIANLESNLDSITVKLTELCLRLHDSRAGGASRVAALAEASIRPLALPDLEICFNVEPMHDEAGLVELEGMPCRVDQAGSDSVRLLLRTNPGEAMGDVATTASGGEMARIYLGLNLFRRSDSRPLLQFFDEVDSGLGMDAATPVAWLLSDLARNSQAICVTHLPTVSVHGRNHWLVSKNVKNGRTTVSLNELKGQERVQEIARQLGGEGWQRGDAMAQLTYARELLDAAGQADSFSAD